jgi:hypothetical protein
MTWEAKPQASPVQSSDRCISGGEMSILKRISSSLSLRQQQPDIFERSRESLLRRCWLFIEVGGRAFEHLV